MLRLMTAKRAPTRQELADILDELFRRVLDDGERTRAMRPNGPPPGHRTRGSTRDTTTLSRINGIVCRIRRNSGRKSGAGRS